MTAPDDQRNSLCGISSVIKVGLLGSSLLIFTPFGVMFRVSTRLNVNTGFIAVVIYFFYYSKIKSFFMDEANIKRVGRDIKRGSYTFYATIILHVLVCDRNIR
jgi:hypothetical protein